MTSWFLEVYILYTKTYACSQPPTPSIVELKIFKSFYLFFTYRVNVNAVEKISKTFVVFCDISNFHKIDLYYNILKSDICNVLYYLMITYLKLVPFEMFIHGIRRFSSCLISVCILIYDFKKLTDKNFDLDKQISQLLDFLISWTRRWE